MDKNVLTSFLKPSETRKLAAVMFADIEGYTALFQQHEDAALEQITTHRGDLQQLVQDHHGNIVKYYGDGSLTVFSSVIEAIQCAISVQQASMKHMIPLRIGIHMGELIEKENDVYGDAVNIASRIQSIGVPGSILVSQTVADQLKNHPGFLLRPLGQYELKNVRKPVVVHAVNAPGLVVPQTLHVPRHIHSRTRFYWIGAIVLLGVAGIWLKDMLSPKFSFHSDDCFIVPPFTSHVTDPEFQFFPYTIASYIGKWLRESAGVDIINERSLSYYTNANVAAAGISPSIARKAGARYAIQGDFALEGAQRDTLRIWMSIIDIRTNTALPIAIPDIICRAANKMECVQEASNVLAGYWRSSKDQLFQFTNDSAYTAYLIAQQKWGNPQLRDEVKHYLTKAITYDPRFIDAWFLMLDLFYNKGEYRYGMDTIALIKHNFPALDQRKQNYLSFYEADFQGKVKQAFDHFSKEYQQNKSDLFINTTGMVMAMEYLNDPALAIRYFTVINPDSMDLSACSYCISRFNIALQAYTDLNQPDLAGKMAARMKPYATKLSQFVRLIDYYVQIRDTAAINDVIGQGVASGNYFDDEQYYCLMAARSAAVNGDTAMRDLYAHRAIRLFGDTTSYTLARIYLLINDLPNAKRAFEREIKRDPDDQRYYALLGVIHARMGDTLQAKKMMQEVAKRKADFDFGETPYMQARIAANLGDKAQALSLCKTALAEGFKFRPNISFQDDPDMAVMNDVPAYVALQTSLRDQY